VSETPFFFKRGDVRLFGLLHAPSQRSSKLAFIMSHPFGEEKLWSHRVFVSMARALADRGHAVLRFDYMGAGDSDGMTEDTTLETHLSDIGAAVATLLTHERHLESVGFIGLRLGATFAALFCERAAAANEYLCVRGAPLVLWDPVVDGREYFQEIFRSNLTTQLAAYGKVLENREVLQAKIVAGGTVNVDGYEVGKGLFAPCAVPALLPLAGKAHSGPTLTVQIAASEQVKDRADLKALAESYPNGTFVRSPEQAFWREIKPFYGRAPHLQQATLIWLEHACG
jgi:pimeloyl-ACP methyl ester carboxylesterase